MTPADADVRSLSERLGLPFEPQDWGIANADAVRVREFVGVCRTASLTPPQQYAMAELVLASMNEALAQGVADDDVTKQFREFLTLELCGLSGQVRYWAGLADRVEFPLAALLHEAAV